MGSSSSPDHLASPAPMAHSGAEGGPTAMASPYGYAAKEGLQQNFDRLSVQESGVSGQGEDSDLSSGGKSKLESKLQGKSSQQTQASDSELASDSQGIKSTGEDWIRDLDRNVEALNRQGHLSRDESPYFLPNRSPWAPRRPGTSDRGCFCEGGKHLRSCEADAGDYGERKFSDQDRSIIDDLTIENKELRRRLIRYEQPTCKHLSPNRLFEITTYGSMSPDQRMQLHDLLQRFALGETFPPTQETSSNIAQTDSAVYRSNKNGDFSDVNKDSAYASGSGSKTTSSELPPLGAPGGKSRRQSGDLRSYTLSSRSEKDKMKAVVKKLEEVFTGRDSTVPPVYEESEQQVEDGRQGAQSGRSIDEEGTREAPIIADHKEFDHSNGSSDSLDLLTGQADQRATHPMELDPGRGQNKEENMEYLSHITATGKESMQGKWIFLNLVTNMAQLHSLSVSKAFVTKAIKTMSRNLELSPDGQMIRYRNGSSSSSSREVDGDVQMDDGSGNGNGNGNGGSSSTSSLEERRKSEFTTFGNNSGSGSGDFGSSNNLSSTNSSFHYRPIFYKADNESESSGESSYLSDSLKGNGSSSGGNSGVYGRRKPYRDGTRIYYLNLPFCTDLVSNPSVETLGSPFVAERFTELVLGDASEKGSEDTFNCEPAHNRELFRVLTAETDDSGSRSPKSECTDLTIFSGDADESCPPSSCPSPIPLKASGIGPTELTDNFATFYLTEHYLGNPYRPPRIIKTETKDLPPSALPPALFLPDSDSDMDGTSDGFADSSSEGNLALLDDDSDPNPIRDVEMGGLMEEDSSPGVGDEEDEADSPDERYLGVVRMDSD